MSPELDKLIQEVITGLAWGGAIGVILGAIILLWLELRDK